MFEHFECYGKHHLLLTIIGIVPAVKCDVNMEVVIHFNTNLLARILLWRVIVTSY